MVLSGDDAAGLLRILDHQRLVQGLDGKHVDDGRLNALFGQLLGRTQRLAHHVAAGDDGRVLALAQHHALADFELGAVLVDAVVALAVGAHVLHAGQLHQLGQDVLHHGGVGGVDDGGAGQRAVHGHILKGHVGAAVVTGGHARVGADHGDVVVGIAAGHKHLVEAAAGRKGAEGMADGLEARSGQTGGDARHIGLGNAHVDGAVGMGLGILGGADAAHQVCVEIDDVGIALQHLGNLRAENILEGAGISASVVNHLHASPPSFLRFSRSALTASM